MVTMLQALASASPEVRRLLEDVGRQLHQLQSLEDLRKL